ncbi:MAG TPA: hypothetical protein VJ963_04620 [Bacteroidales bacterium]|nr:hypothetical protein [Bacteroidales bacterium]
MKFREKYDKQLSGLLSGFLLPFVIALVIFSVSAHGRSAGDYIHRIYTSGIVTHAISLCVFPNVVIFLVFNRFDMLRAARGVLASTIVWAILVFAIKFLL